MWNLKPLLTVSLIIFKCVQCYHFLGIFPIPIKSHMIIFASLMKELARKGHNVTVVSPFPEKDFLPNYRNIDLSEYLPKLVEVIDITVEKADSKMLKYTGPIATSRMGDLLCESLSSPPYQNFLKTNESFDAIIIEYFNTDCYLSIAHQIKAPIIGFSSSGLVPWLKQRFGIPSNPAYIPEIFLGLSDKMEFLERVENTLLLLFHNLYNNVYRYAKDQEVVRKYIGPHATDLDSLARNSSLFLVNTHFTINLPTPLPPNVIEVGGIHIDKPSPLPEKLKNWIEDSPNGIIFFSMGLMTKGQSLPKDKINSFIDAFELLPQRVIWKWENDTMEGKTEKILLQKRLPQLGVLCHPNVKLFISHGGCLSIMEAVYCGVPVVVMPQFGDQHFNAKALEVTGAAVVLPISKVTKGSAYEAMWKAIQLRDEMKSLSNRFKDRPLTPLQAAVYWTEYVVRHKGAPFMKSAAVDMPFYQYYLLDVLLFIFIFLITLGYFVLYVVKLIINIVSKTKAGKLKKK